MMATEKPTEAERLAAAHRVASEAAARPKPTVPSAAEEQALYLRFLEKQRLAAEERKKEAQRKDEQLTRDIEATVARSLGAAADDGTGRCQWCRLELGTDAEGHRTHMPTRACSGPAPAACELCGRPWIWSGAPDYAWTHSCGARPRRHHEDVQLEKVQSPHEPRTAHPQAYLEQKALPAPAKPLEEEEGPDPFGVRGPQQRGDW